MEKNYPNAIFGKCSAILFFLFSFLFANFSFGQTQSFSTSGSLTRPANVTHMTIEAWGGGGAGGGTNTTTTHAAGGGGGGGYARRVNLVLGATTGPYAYTVGLGGTGAINTNGTNGTSTTATINGTTITADFGRGGVKASSGLGGLGGTVNVGDIGAVFSGGNGAAGSDSNYSGGGGGSAGGGGNGGNATTSTGGNAGVAGSYTIGVAGSNGRTTSNSGLAGTGFGAGGGGAYGRNTGSAGWPGGNGSAGQIIFRYISVSSIAPSPVCIGTTITITGTGFATTGSTTVSINGTSCTSVTVLNSTTITAVVATGTTSGVVLVTNPNGINNGQTLTINGSTAPAITTQPVATSICTNATGTFSVIATNASTYQWRRNGVNLSNTAPYSGVNTATLTITNPALADAGNFDVVVSNAAGCFVISNSVALTINALTAITANPANSSIAVGANTSFSVTASNSPTSYIWEVSTNGGGAWSTVTNGGVYSTATTATLNITAAPLSMNGYMYRASATNSCGTSAVSSTATLTVFITYCTPTGNLNCTASDYISNVTLNTLNNSSTCSAGGYTNYPATGTQTTSVQKGSTYNLSLSVGAGTGTHGAGVWIDFNQNGSFSDAGEFFLVSNTIIPSTTTTVPIAIPIGATAGATRMRIRYAYAITVTSGVGMSCTMAGTYGETEDYTITLVDPPACSNPTAAATGLSFGPNGTSISGSFTAASPAPDSYLVVVSTSATPPTAPTNGVSYTIGGTLAPGYTIVDNDTNTSFTATGLTTNTTYYFYIYSFNGLCTGGPLYYSTPLTGNATTLSVNYCAPTTTNGGSSLYISRVEIIGTLNDPGVNNSTYSTVAPIGYQDFTTLSSKARQAQGEGVNLVTTCAGTQRARGTWKAWVDWNKDGDFVDLGEEVYNIQGWVGQTQTFGFIVPAGQTPGDYRIRIRVNNGETSGGAENYGYNFTPCDNFGTSGGNTYFGEAEDYLFTVIANCASKITSVTPNFTCGTGTVNLAAVGTGATQYRWYDSEFGGSLLASTASGNWTTPSISTTTTYWVTSFNGTCESVSRTEITATVKPITTLTVSNATPTVCGEGSIIDLSAIGGNEVYHLIDETFEAGSLGVFSNVNNDASTDSGKAARAWANQTSTYVPNSTNGNTWFPAIASGFGTNKFALAKSDSNPIPNATIENSLTSNAMDGTGVSNLKLKLKLYYSRYWADGTHPLTTDPQPEYVTIEATTNNWATTTVLATFIDDTGIGSRFASLPVYSLPAAFNNQATIKIRVKHVSYGSGTGYLGDGVAVDDIELYGDKPLTNPSFVLSGTPTPAAFTTALCTPGSEYLGGPVPKIWVKPTLPQLELGTYSFTATATLSNLCPISATINVTNQSKVWKGTIDNDWNKAGNWSPSVIPDATTCVIIPTATNAKIINTPNALAKNLTVKAPTGNLELQASQNLTVTDWINVESGATFNVRNSANLVQINDAAVNTGSINMNRIATGLHAKDYIYWSSPVENFGVANVSPLTSTSRIYNWVPDYFNGAGYGYGNWFNVNENMTAGKGYIIRVPNSNPTYTATFNGKPQNGVITRTIVRGPYTGANYVGTNGVTITNEDDNWNLVGNPYPSAIDAVEFLAANNASIAGQVNLWTHSTPISISSSPYYQAFVYNYKSNDYVTYNSAGSNIGPTLGFNGKIGAGQAFFVKRLDGAAGSGTITFNNGMRTDATNNPYNNGQFYKTSGDETAPAEPERHRIWLDLIDSSYNTSRVMFGYVEGATNAKDHMFDATTNYTESLKAFTNIDKEEEIYVIQAKGLPFNTSDKISYGIQVPATGSYSIAISDVDGLFKTEGQKIYIEDLSTNTTHDLTVSPYTFSADAGISKNRFVIKFDNQTLSNNDNAYANSVIVFGQQQLTVKSELFNIKNIVVYDILGKTLLNVKDANTKEYTLANLKNTNSALLVKTTLENGSIVTKKVIF